MKISVVSDLHLEFLPGPIHLPGGDILLLAGDIFNVFAMNPKKNDARNRKTRKAYIRFIQKELTKYQDVIYVMGNHEFYGGHIDETKKTIRDFITEHSDNIVLMENESMGINGVIFIGSTFWTQMGIGTGDSYYIRRGMNDFRWIDTKGAKISPNRLYTVPGDDGINALAHKHLESVDYLKLMLKYNYDKIVVVTHHAPSFHCSSYLAGRVRDSVLDGAYCSNQENLILDNPEIKYWIHGHLHTRAKFKIGDTEIISNCRGYNGLESKGWDPSYGDFEI